MTLSQEQKPKEAHKFSVKAVASLADFGSSYWQEGSAVKPDVERSLLRKVANGSETVDGILRHMTDDIANAGHKFKPHVGVKEPSPEQLDRLNKFFSKPNPDDVSDEWLENFVYDLILYGDAFWEKVGTNDVEDSKNNYNWFGGDLVGIFHIDGSTMFILANNKTGQLSTDPEEMCYQQTVHGASVYFNARKIIRTTRFKKGRTNGQSPLTSLLNVIAGQINLTGYMGKLYKGAIPKTIINAGDYDPDEMDRLITLVRDQLNVAQNPYGMIMVNVPNGFQLQKLMDSAESGKFLETLAYYREEICSVFGIPPTKMGLATPGKLGDADNQDDTYYDIIERIQRKIEKAIYNGIITEMGCTDWDFKFNTLRPKQIKTESEARAKNANACRIGRQEGFLSVNEARSLFEVARIDEPWADDVRYPSPSILAKQGEIPPDMQDGDNIDEGDQQEEGIVVDKYFPYRKKVIQKKNPKVKPYPAKGRPSKEQLNFIKRLDRFKDIKAPIIRKYLLGTFASTLYENLMRDVKKIKMGIRANDLDYPSPEDYEKMYRDFEVTLEDASSEGVDGLKKPTKQVFKDTMKWIMGDAGMGISFNEPDKAVLDYLQNEYFPPMFERLTTDETPYNYKNTLKDILDQSADNHWNWQKTVREFEDFLNPESEGFPRWMYERVVVTETARFVVEGHMRGHVQMGFKNFRRIETEDDVTNPDCLEHNNWIYPAEEAEDVIPAHPFCRGDMTPEPNEEEGD
ncbi:phage portal protein [Sulfuricurvum sp.]|uniref:phage portal protein n=1 Tax=Sulfuricurvum sp. TaxID=2025608 RepID=UPI003568C6A7